MAVGARNLVAVSYIPETAYGTAKTDKLMAFPYAGELPALDPQYEFLKDQIFGKMGQLGGELVQLSGTWSPNQVLNPSNAAVLLRYALGTIAKTNAAGETTVFDFNLTESAGDVGSTTLVAQTDVGKVQFPGAKLTGLRISGRAGQFWMIQPTWGLQGVQAAAGAVVMPAIKNEDNFIFADGALTLDGTDISSEVAGVDLNINLESDASNEYGMGSVARVSHEIINRVPTGQIIRRYNAAGDTLISQIIGKNQAAKPLVLTLTGKTATGAVASTPYKIEITIPAIKLLTPAITGGRSKLMLPLNFEAEYDFVTGKNLSAKVTSNTDYTT